MLALSVQITRCNKQIFFLRYKVGYVNDIEVEPAEVTASVILNTDLQPEKNTRHDGVLNPLYFSQLVHMHQFCWCICTMNQIISL